MARSGKEHIVILGGGAIGVCCAYYLALAGKPVTLVEKRSIGSGCSYGNVGLVALSHCIPLPTRGVVGKALRWMFDSSSPFYLKPRLDWSLFAWLIRFARACNDTQMRCSMAILRDLAYASIDLYDTLAARQDLAFHYQHSGLLGLFRTEQGLEEAHRHAELLRDFGIEACLLSCEAVRRKEPLAADNVSGGLEIPGDRSLVPSAFVQQLCQLAQKHGARVETHAELIDLSLANGEITAIRTSAGDLRPSTVILSAGAWSTAIANQLSFSIPLQPGKGYSVALSRANSRLPERPVWLGEAHVLLTPMNDIVRVGGTMELAGMDETVNLRRVDAVLGRITEYLPHARHAPPVEVWSGLRPCTPDGLPIIGWAPTISNLMLATGHGMLGISLAPVTGRLVADAICGNSPLLNIEPLSLDRFN